MQFECIHCGSRDEREFQYGGQAHIHRPGGDVSDRAWANYLFVRENPAGWHVERWCHLGGCGRWFHMARNTVTHEVRAVYSVDLPRAAIAV